MSKVLSFWRCPSCSSWSVPRGGLIYSYSNPPRCAVCGVEGTDIRGWTFTAVVVERVGCDETALRSTTAWRLKEEWGPAPGGRW